MAVAAEKFGTLDSAPVHSFTLRNANGCIAKLIDFGARLTEMHVPDQHGKTADVVLGFDTLERYVATDHYFGATCGRYGNRIRRGRFSLDGHDYAVTCNEAANHLHGGKHGFDKRIWNAFLNANGSAITFTLFSPDGEEGFPGDLTLASTYELTADNRLLMTMTGVSTKPTVLNMVNHTYWNMAGHASGTINEQLLTVDADFLTPVDGELLATGEIATVAGTAFDFREAKPIGRDMEKIPTVRVAQLVGGGYDHNWVLRGGGPGLHQVSTLLDPQSGRGMVLRSTEPGVQIYVGGYMSEKMIGKGNTPYRAYAGVTFETQKFPDSPNFAHFPSTRLDPGAVYQHRMEVAFFNR